MSIYDLFAENTHRVSYGFDLGTYCSYLSYVEPNSTAQIVPYSGHNRYGIPSLFWRTDDGQERSCDEVVESDGLSVDPAGVCSSIKTKLSLPGIVLNGHSYKPSEILEKEVRRIMRVSGEALERNFMSIDEADHLVVGVPVKFTAAEKGTLHDVLKKGTGIQSIRLVPEPILAALLYESYEKDGSDAPVIVYDLGAGTFDVCAMIPNARITAADPYPFIVRTADGLKIAGDRFDEIMEELIMKKIREHPGQLQLSILENLNHVDRRKLREKAREVKEELSFRSSYDCIISGVECGMGRVIIKADEFEKAVSSEIQKTVDLTYRVCKDAGFIGNPNLKIMLVGGSTYMPVVTKMLMKKFRWLKQESIRQKMPEKAVALGAALFSQNNNLVDNTPVPFTYAVRCYLKDDLVLSRIIPRDSRLPYSEAFDFHTHDDNQRYIQFTVYEIESGTDKENYALHEGSKTEYMIEHDFRKEVPINTDVKLFVSLSEEGILTLRVSDYGISKAGDTVKTVKLL